MDSLNESYASLKYSVDYSKKGSFSLKTDLSYLANHLGLKSKLKKVIAPAYPFTLVKLVKWNSLVAGESSETKYKFEEDNIDLKALRLRLRTISDTYPKIPGHEYQLLNYITGPDQKFIKSYNLSLFIDLDEENKQKNADLMVRTPLVFDYT